MHLLPRPQVLDIKDGYIRHKAFKIKNLCSDVRIERATKCLEKSDEGVLLALKCGAGDSEAYTLDAGEDGITIFGEGVRGLFYGIQTLKQLLENGDVPYLHIEDKPDMEYRGFYHDITRGRVPTVASMKQLIDDMAYYKMNSLQLYVEHTFPFKELGDSVEKFGYLTADEIKELDDYCYDNFIEFIPSIATFGHLYELLQREEYKELQCISDYKDKHHFWIERMGHHTIDPLNDSSIEIIKSLIDQYAPLFRTDKFNICCDETFDLKRGKYNALDTGALYVEFVKKIIAHLKSKGKKVMMWGDIVLQHPEVIKEIPEDTVMLNWCYGENPPEKSFETFKNSGFCQIVCPGTWTWYSFVERIDLASKNICRMLDYGYKYGAAGMLNTNWGDYGHPCSIELSVHGFVLGAAKSWNKLTEKNGEFDCAIGFLQYKNADAERYVSTLDAVCNSIKYRDFVRCYSNIVCGGGIAIEYPTLAAINEAVSACKAIINELGAKKWEREAYRREILICAEAIIVMAELLAKLSGYSITRCSDTGEWLEKYRESWLLRNKESELCEIEKMFITLENV